MAFFGLVQHLWLELKRLEKPPEVCRAAGGAAAWPHGTQGHGEEGSQPPLASEGLQAEGSRVFFSSQHQADDQDAPGLLGKPIVLEQLWGQVCARALSLPALCKISTGNGFNAAASIRPGLSPECSSVMD